MPKATLPSGALVPLDLCYINIPDLGIKIVMNILPDISDSKSVSYADESAIGRSMPFKSYQNSDNRTISWTAHFFICTENDKLNVIKWKRALEACLYPQTENTNGAPYAPPPICKLRCGEQLSSLESQDICAVLKSCSFKADTTVPWYDNYIPAKLDIDMQFDVVYNQASLPGAELIMKFGY